MSYDPKREVWTIEVPGDSGFGTEALLVLTLTAAERPQGPSREVFERLVEAFREAIGLTQDDSRR